jgi:hypothetical protein
VNIVAQTVELIGLQTNTTHLSSYHFFIDNEGVGDFYEVICLYPWVIPKGIFFCIKTLIKGYERFKIY